MGVFDIEDYPGLLGVGWTLLARLDLLFSFFFCLDRRHRAVARRPRNCTMCRECIRIPPGDRAIKLSRVRDHFICVPMSHAASLPVFTLFLLFFFLALQSALKRQASTLRRRCSLLHWMFSNRNVRLCFQHLTLSQHLRISCKKSDSLLQFLLSQPRSVRKEWRGGKGRRSRPVWLVVSLRMDFCDSFDSHHLDLWKLPAFELQACPASIWFFLCYWSQYNYKKRGRRRTQGPTDDHSDLKKRKGREEEWMNEFSHSHFFEVTQDARRRSENRKRTGN